jgi:hypothetical protein
VLEEIETHSMILPKWSKKPDLRYRYALPGGTHDPVLLRRRRSVRQSFDVAIPFANKATNPWAVAGLGREKLRVASRLDPDS